MCEELSPTSDVHGYLGTSSIYDLGWRPFCGSPSTPHLLTTPFSVCFSFFKEIESLILFFFLPPPVRSFLIASLFSQHTVAHLSVKMAPFSLSLRQAAVALLLANTVVGNQVHGGHAELAQRSILQAGRRNIHELAGMYFR